MKLTWDDRNLWRLVVKRAIDSPCFSHWLKSSPVLPELTAAAVESAGEPALHPCLDRLFDRHIWTGKNSLSRNWLLRRLKDAWSVIYPRDLICLLHEALQKESSRIREGARSPSIHSFRGNLCPTHWPRPRFNGSRLSGKSTSSFATCWAGSRDGRDRQTGTFERSRR